MAALCLRLHLAHHVKFSHMYALRQALMQCAARSQ